MKELSNSKRKASTEASSTHGVSRFTHGFFEVDHQFKIIYCSEEIETFLQRSSDPITRLNFWELATSSPYLKWLSLYQNNVGTVKAFTVKQFLVHENIWIEAQFLPTKRGISIYLSDISHSEFMLVTVESEKDKFYRLFDLSPVPQWVYDTETLFFLDVNEAAIYHYGYSREEFLKMTISQIRPQDQIEVLELFLKENIKDGVFIRRSAIHQLKNKKIRHVKIESSSITFKGRSARLIVALDFTEQYLAQVAMKNSERRFRALVQEGSDLIAVLDQDGNYKYVNDSSRVILNLAPEDLIGRSPAEFIHPEDRERVMADLAKLKQRKRMEIAPFRFVDGDNNIRWIATILTDMTHESSIDGIIANSRDVTEIIVGKLETQKSIERYDIVSKATSDAIWDWDLLTDEIVWNSGVQEIFGYENLIYTAEWYRSKIHPDDLYEPDFQKYLDSLVDGNSRITTEFRFKCADGSYRAVLDRSFVIFDTEKKPIRMIGSMQDITTTKNHISAIEQQNKKLQEISWLQSHAVRAPLASILGLTQLIDPKHPDPDLIQLLKFINSSAEELDAVIKNIVKKTQQ